MMNNSYNGFASVYDELTDNINYKVGCDYISDFFYRYGVLKDGEILDCACGTGTLTELFCKKGFKTSGIDLSPQMLSVAVKKCSDATFYECDISMMPFRNMFDGVCCALDSVNHLVEKQKIRDFFLCVNNSLRDGGVFVFDVNTPHKHNDILSGNTFVFDEEDFFLSWDNEDMGDNTVRILLDLFTFNGTNYDRESEEFFEKAYENEDMKELVQMAGFEVLGMYDNLTLNPPNNDSERIFFVCRKK